MVDDLRGRARLRRALQPRRDLRVRAHPALPVAARGRILGARRSRARSRRRAAPRARSGTSPHVGATLPSGSQAQSFLWELVMSVFLMFVIMAVATDTRAVGEAAAIAIGGTIGLDAMFGGPISGASMNPARSLAPALVSGNLHALWIYLLAPVSGPRSAGSPTSSCAASSRPRSPSSSSWLRLELASPSAAFAAGRSPRPVGAPSPRGRTGLRRRRAVQGR